MITALRPRTLVLFAGDIIAFVLSLWLSLWARTGSAPSGKIFLAHLGPFCLLFVAWIVVFFIAGLYERRLLSFGPRALGETLFPAQVFNIIIAALFFSFIPLFGIAPKTVLVIYLAVSLAIVFCWRIFIYPLFGLKKETALMAGEGVEIDELLEALRQAPRAPVGIVAQLAPGSVPEAAAAAMELVRIHSPQFIIADWNDARVVAAFPNLPQLTAQGIRFVDAMSLYEEVFGRVPLRVLDGRWFARHASRYAHTLYDPLKRAMDIVIGTAVGLASLIFYPFIALAIKLDDGGPIFVRLPRVGLDGKVVYIPKFRSMSGNDQGAYGQSGRSELSVTRAGEWLRTTRLDELPQLWSVVAGDLSLIGPRPETPALVEIYEKEIPHYGVRHLMPPGLSGWAQLYHDNHPHAVSDVSATREKLSYDLYYLKHRSLVLDAAVALKTIKKLLSKSGA
jgi:lipopolysaccharide/colanic/teichoic acid biosynthesis glycosyltransferase